MCDVGKCVTNLEKKINQHVQSYICTKFGDLSSKKWAQECQKSPPNLTVHYVY